MGSYGVVASGFARKTQAVIEEEIKADQLAEIQGNLNQLPTAIVGQWNGIFSDKLREIWELLEAVYRSQYPDSANDEALDQVSSITGAFRLTEEPSTVDLQVNLNGSVFLPAGRIVSDPITGVQWVTLEPLLTPPGPPANYSIAAQSVDNGPIAGVAGTITQIDTPIAGWNTVTNPLDADPGRDRETDDAFRLRRELLLRISGAATRDAIRSAVLDVAGVSEVIVFENDSDVTDGFGLPPHSFEVIVLGGADADIAQVILDTKAAGIATYGSSSDTATDSQGVAVTIYFSRPTPVLIYVDVTIDIDPATYPVDGDDQVEAAIVAYGDALQIGDDVIYNQVLCAHFDVSGVLDTTALILDVSAIPPASGTSDIVILPRSLALFDTSRIAVTTV